jgi:hypothetical protein
LGLDESQRFDELSGAVAPTAAPDTFCLDLLVRLKWNALRALCNGKTSAFQADDAGSIPAARSKPSTMVLNVYLVILASLVED